MVPVPTFKVTVPVPVTVPTVDNKKHEHQAKTLKNAEHALKIIKSMLRIR
jgi:hypothetical protein